MSRLVFAACVSVVIVGLSCNAALAARYVPVEVILNGEVILKGNASDDGHRDADEIWDSLKLSDLKETEAFKKLKIDPKLNEYKFDLAPPEKGKAWPIQIDASYGGVADTRFLTIRRVTTPDKKDTWRIDAKDLDEKFDTRMISREEAGQLKKPKATER